MSFFAFSVDAASLKIFFPHSCYVGEGGWEGQAARRVWCLRLPGALSCEGGSGDDAVRPSLPTGLSPEPPPKLRTSPAVLVGVGMPWPKGRVTRFHPLSDPDACLSSWEF